MKSKRTPAKKLAKQPAKTSGRASAKSSVVEKSNRSARPDSRVKKQSADSWVIGNLCNARKKELSSPINSLKYNTLVCGSTGSGKTNTCFNLIESVLAKGVPFLVIEPSKSEYRHLLIRNPELFETCKIFTPGDERLAPFRINPFEFGKNVSIQAHIDALLAIFNASFEMYSPMPQVLSKAICTLYEERGWDLGQNTNPRLSEGFESGNEEFPSGAFPTMRDLYDCIDTITESFNYTEAIGPDLRSALKARIGSLLIGAKGLVFGQSRSVSIPNLFSVPTIIELGDRFNSCEESFLTGVLLLYLFEFRKSKGTSNKLEHLLLIEDAQRVLIKESHTSLNDYRPFTPRPSEVFAKLFSESSRYGQGIVIASQTPSSLIPEIAGNSNLKILHRLLSSDDLRIVAPPSFLTEKEQKNIVSLDIGEALVIDRAMASPQKVQVRENPNATAGAKTDSRDANAKLKSLYDQNKAARSLTLAETMHPEEFDETCDSQEIIVLCQKVANDPGFRSCFNSYVVACISDLTQIVQFRASLIYEIQRIIGARGLERLVDITWGALVLVSDRYFERKGEDGFWSFAEVKAQKLRWLNLMKQAFLPAPSNHLDINVLKLWKEDLVAIQERPQGPYPTCAECKAKCLYRFEVSEIVKDPKTLFDFNSSLNREDTEASEAAAWFCMLLSERMIGKFELELAYCLAVHFIKDQTLSTYAQLVLMNKIRTHLEGYALEASTSSSTSSTGSSSDTTP